MKISAEHYKGIDFVQISVLPEEQKRLAWISMDEKKIIKILRHEELLRDCIQYSDYVRWYDQAFKPHVTPGREVVMLGELNLALK